jgi:hypothetical protein
MQLITRTETGGYEAWRSDFDDQAERRGRAGLSLLQIWRDLDAPDTVLLLFEATDRDRAEAYLKERDQMGHGLGAATFLSTA